MYNYLPENSSTLIEKFVCSMMWDGKKNVARQILADCFLELKNKGHKDPQKAFENAVKNVMPEIEVRPKRVGGAVYQIPMEVNSKRQLSLAIRWILNSSRKKKGKPISVKLAEEINDALNDQGEAYKKKMDVKKMAEANKAFAHLANY
jgi:small subunit ribosomal protein S7